MDAMARRETLIACLYALLILAPVQGSVVPFTAHGTGVDDAYEDRLHKGYLELRKSQTDFDYFVFAQQWPGTYCKNSGTCCQKVERSANFTIHGVWPEYDNGSWPECCSGPGFDQDKIDELAGLLQQYWPTMSCGSPRQCSGKRTGSFWQHEWEKHGTCAYPIIPDEATYFTVGLNLRLRYDIAKILNDAGFVASSTKQYLKSDVVAAVEAAVGARPTFTCKRKQISEIWICLTKDLKIRNCGSSSNSCSQYLLIPPLE